MQARLSSPVSEFALPALAIAVLLATLMVGVGLWHVARSPSRELVATPLPVRMVAAVVAPPAATRPDPQASSEPVALLAANALSLDPPAAAVAKEAAEPPLASSSAPRREARSESRRRSALPAAEPRRVALNARSAEGPLARCEGLTFIAHAVCINNRCAQPSNARHPQCAQVVRQRLVDEARRNPTLVN